MCVGPIQERDARAVRRHVARVMAALGAAQLRTDELSVHEGIAPEGQHRICLAHWCQSKGKRAWDLYGEAVEEDRPLEAQSMQDLLGHPRVRPRPPTLPTGSAVEDQAVAVACGAELGTGQR